MSVAGVAVDGQCKTILGVSDANTCHCGSHYVYSVPLVPLSASATLPVFNIQCLISATHCRKFCRMLV